MENASKALLMAGGILIAIIIIALFIRSYGNISKFQKTRLTEKEQEQLIAFNEQYTKYLGQYVYGTEVRTLQNKYENNNKVEVVIEGSTPQTGKDTQFYKCTSVGYDDNGQVNSIAFKEITMSAEEES